MTRISIQYRCGFTLMELMVAVALLTGVILGVGVIFQSTSRAVSLSQATSEAFAGVRALSRQIEKDISGLDPNGFLVIRSRTLNGRRHDQIAFLATGSFRNPTGTTSTAGPFTDRSIASAAHIWYGQLVVAADDTTVDGTTYTNESVPVPLNAPPTGTNDQDFVLGRHVTCLFPDDGQTSGTNHSSIQSVQSIPILAFRRNVATNIAFRPDLAAPYGAAIPQNGLPGGELQTTVSHITNSRCAAAGYTSSMIMNSIIYEANNSAANGVRITAGTAASRWEAYKYCYRFRVLPSVWSTATTDTSTSAPSTTNGYFRMHPILQKGVPSFAVEWTDGSTDVSGALRWFGSGAAHGGYSTETQHTEPTVANSDDYVAQFTFDNKLQWPKALKFTYRVTDPNDRLAGGRTFVQIVALPK